MSNIKNNFIDSIGNTPLIKLKAASEITGCNIYGKAEFLNPGGSVKDRAALALLKDAQEKKLISKGGIVVEGTAGNTGIGLGLLGNSLGYKTIIVMNDNQTQEKKDTLRNLGAELRLVAPKPYKDENNFVKIAGRLADELRSEQEQAQALERGRRLGEAQVKDMQGKLDEAEMTALKGGKKAMNKMETRIRELESELEAETRRQAEAQKSLNKSERRIKELTFAADEDRKNHERMQSLVDQLQTKIKSYKKQIEEAEEIAALNLAKFRQAQGNLADAEERADLNEQALAKAKARGRAGSAAPLMVRQIN